MIKIRTLWSILLAVLSTAFPQYFADQKIGFTDSGYFKVESISETRQSATTSKAVVWDHDPGYGYASGIIQLVENGAVSYVYCIEPYVQFPQGNTYVAFDYEDPGVRAILEYGFPINKKELQVQFGKSAEQAYVATYVALNTYLGTFNEKTVRSANDGYVNALLDYAQTGLSPQVFSVTSNAEIALYDVSQGLLKSQHPFTIQATHASESVFEITLPDSKVWAVDEFNHPISQVGVNMPFYLVTDDLKRSEDGTALLTSSNSVSLTRYESHGVQTLVSAKATGESELAITQRFEPAPSTLIIQKVDAHEQSLAEVVFDIITENGDLIGTYRTDEIGEIRLDITPQRIHIKEVEGHENMIVSEDVFTLDLEAGHTHTLVVENEYLRGKLRIYKVDEVSGQALEDVRFGVFSKTDIFEGKTLLYEAGTCILEGTTNSDGIFEVDNLPIGIYEVKELEAAQGYHPLEFILEVSINAESLEKELKVENKPITPEPPIEEEPPITDVPEIFEESNIQELPNTGHEYTGYWAVIIGVVGSILVVVSRRKGPNL